MTDTTDMLAVHDGLRHEFARLPITVKAVAEGDAERAAVVGGHVLFMADFLHAHHASEDEIVWPLLRERAPEHDALVDEMAGQHASMHATVDTVRAQAEAWIATAGMQERSALHTTLIALEREILHHFALEEQDVLPLIQRDLTPEEWPASGSTRERPSTPRASRSRWA